MSAFTRWRSNNFLLAVGVYLLYIDLRATRAAPRSSFDFFERKKKKKRKSRRVSRSVLKTKCSERFLRNGGDLHADPKPWLFFLFICLFSRKIILNLSCFFYVVSCNRGETRVPTFHFKHPFVIIVHHVVILWKRVEDIFRVLRAQMITRIVKERRRQKLNFNFNLFILFYFILKKKRPLV